MEKHVNASGRKSWKIYLKPINQWVSVSEEIYRDFYRPIWAHQAKARSRGQCKCKFNELWLCDTECHHCEFRTESAADLSLNAPINEDETFIDLLESPGSDAGEIACNRILLRELISLLREIDSDGEKIAELLMRETSVTDMADALGRKRMTFNDQLVRIRSMLKEHCGV